jgi:hypothetical protein
MKKKSADNSLKRSTEISKDSTVKNSSVCTLRFEGSAGHNRDIQNNLRKLGKAHNLSPKTCLSSKEKFILSNHNTIRHAGSGTARGPENKFFLTRPGKKAAPVNPGILSPRCRTHRTIGGSVWSLGGQGVDNETSA